MENTIDKSIETRKELKKRQRNRKILVNWQLYVLLIVPFSLLIIFSYMPMYGVQLAFKNFKASLGIAGSEWAGFIYFQKFFSDYQFKRVISNTLNISIYSLVTSFPISILFALTINYLRSARYRKIVQTVTYMPYLISTVVMVAMLYQILAPRRGLLTVFLNFILGTDQDFLANPAYFDDIYVWSGIWQATGFNSIIYIATLIGVDPEMHEAAVVDGANKFHRVIYIDLPFLLPTAAKLFILNMGQLLNVGHEKALLMQNPLNLPKSEIISTYVYKVGLTAAVPQYSYSTAIGLFQSVIGFVLIVSSNKIMNRLDGNGIW